MINLVITLLVFTFALYVIWKYFNPLEHTSQLNKSSIPKPKPSPKPPQATQSSSTPDFTKNLTSRVFMTSKGYPRIVPI